MFADLKNTLLIGHVSALNSRVPKFTYQQVIIESFAALALLFLELCVTKVISTYF